MAVERTVWFSFHFGGHISAVSLSALNVSALTQTLPQCWDQTPASVSPLAEGRSSPALSPVYPSSSFVLLSFPWLGILCSTGRVLLSALSWCSGPISVSKGVFLMYPWRETYSTTTYSSTILFSPSLS